jgi:hypothetical protein
MKRLRQQAEIDGETVTILPVHHQKEVGLL